MLDSKTVRRSLLAVTLVLGSSPARTWQQRFVDWHDRNEFRSFGSSNSANLAWWESYLLNAYLHMHAATGDHYWLDRFTAHADTMLAVMRDAPDSGDCWPGYRDGFLGWGTTRYDPDRRYQEYLVHDGQICLPLARFSRLVLGSDGLLARFGEPAERYRWTIEAEVVAKWYRNWGAERGGSEHLAGFGGCARLPYNQFLVFGELLLVLADIPATAGPVPRSFHSAVADSMARLFRKGLDPRPFPNAWVWFHSPEPAPRCEDVSHANLDISFALEASRQGLVFDSTDLRMLGRTLTGTMWNRSETEPAFSRFVDGTGGQDDNSNLKDWLRLGIWWPEALRLIRRAYEGRPEWTGPRSTSSCRAQVAALLAEFEARVAAPEEETPGRPLTEPRNEHLLPARPAISPNPCRTRTTISFSVSSPTPEPRPLTPALRIYDAAGVCVRVLPIPHSPLPITLSVAWDCRDESGRWVPPGVYCCVIAGSGLSSAARVTVIPAHR